MSEKTRRFSELLLGPELAFAMEAHNGLSAKIVEEAGFPLIWASGLAISAALGLRDRNEASWTQVLETLEFMADGTSIPILVDGDTGHGDFNNFRRLVTKLCQRDIAAVCIEDKVFPKTNSFLDGDQSLADVKEFCGKIRAGKDSQSDPDFRIIARTEAFIAGRSRAEALDRAAAYAEAGADGILVHSRTSNADQVLGFAAEWQGMAPLLIIPTKYYATPTALFRKAGISIVIWANHTLRTAISAMREVSRQIFAEQSLINVEGRIAGLDEVFRIVGNDELAEAERRYLPAGAHSARAIILAATRGAELAELTLDKPKCMLDIRGEPLLARLAAALGRVGIAEKIVVGGYQEQAITVPGIRLVRNGAYATTGEVASLSCAIAHLRGDCLICYGDVLCRDFVLTLLLQADEPITVVVDARNGHTPERNRSRLKDWAVCSTPYSDDPLEARPVFLRGLLRTEMPNDAQGEFVGLIKVNADGGQMIRAEADAMQQDGTAEQASLPDLLNRLIEKDLPIGVLYIIGHWLDVNDVYDLASVRNFL
ncbi:MAG: phosphoenolpyruvate mutase [Bacteroidota bacterium]